MRKLINKRWLLIATMLVVAIVLSGCGNGNNNNEGTSEESSNSSQNEEKKNITMWIKSTPEEQALFEEEANLFNSQQNSIHVEIVPFGTDQYISAMQAAISGDSLPDIMQLSPQIPLVQMQELDLIQPIPFTEELMAQYDDGTWVEGKTTLGGEPYVWPNRSFKTAASIMFYNKKVMSEMGLDPNQPPSTWEELYTQSKKVTDQGNGEIFGVSVGLKQDWFVEQLIMQMATSVDGKGIQSIGDFPRIVNWKSGELFQPDAVKQTVEAFKLWKDEKVIDPNALIYTSAESAASFGEGESAFHLNGQWQLAFFKSKYPDLDFGVALLPSKSADIPTYYGTVGGSDTGFTVSKKSKNIAAATEWLTHLSKVHYPNVVEKYIALSPIPSVNVSNEVTIGPELKQLIEVSDTMFKLVPNPSVRDPLHLGVFVNLKTKSATEPLGPTLQGYWNDNGLDLDKYLTEYAAEQQEFLQEAIESVPGADINDWKFDNWNIHEDYTMDKYE